MGSHTENPAPSIPLMNKKSPELLGYLDYELIELDNTQKRLAGRKALKPKINVTDYTTSAVIDWIDIRVLLNRRTQFRHLQENIAIILNKKVHIENSLVAERAHNAVFSPVIANTSDDVFYIRFQEPDIVQLRSVMAMIKTKYGLALDPLISGIEISVDFYPKIASALDRAKMVRVLTNHLITKRDIITEHRDRPRAVWGKFRGEYQRVLAGNPNFSENANTQLLIDTEWDHAPYADATVEIGAKEADVRWRIMDKVIDTQNRSAGTYVSLKEEEKRTRIEVTLTGEELDELNLQTFDDLAELNFSSLQGRYFRFQLPTLSGRVVHRTKWREAITVARDRQRLEKFRKGGGIGVKAMDVARTKTQNKIPKATILDLHHKGLKVPLRNRTGIGVAGTFVAYEELNERVLTALRSLGVRVRKGFAK